jgi:hypothetical protein
MFGSILDVETSSTQPWLVTIPEQVGNIAKDQWGDFQVQPMTGSLTASGSPYHSTLSFIDPKASNTPRTANVTFTILPRPTITPSTVGPVDFTAVFAGANPTSQTFTLSNTGLATSLLNFTIGKEGHAGWLTVTPSTGGPLLPSDSPVTVTLSVVTGAMTQGLYTEILRISDPVATNDPVEIQVRLNIIG